MKEIVIELDIKNVKVNEEVNEIYVYDDHNKRKFSVYYNDEYKLPINVEKLFLKRYGKIKNFYDIIEDIKINYNKNIFIIYYLKD